MERQTGFYGKLEGLPRQERRKKLWERTRRFLRKAATASGEFGTRLAAAGMKPEDIRRPEDLARVPVLRKKELAGLQAQGARLGGLLTTELGELSRIYLSPGGILDPEGRTPDYWGWTEAFYAAGFRPNDLVQMTFGYHLTPAGLMLEEPLRTIGCAVIPAGPGNTPVQVELMTRLPVTGFVGMASYLRTIAEKGVADGLDLRRDFNLRVAFVAAERLPEGLRRELEDGFGMVVRQGYGTADVGCIAYECLELGGMHLSSRCWVEICDPDTGLPVDEGEMGEVVVTPLAEAYPLVRLATGDLSRLTTGECGCGRTAEKLEAILGRVDDTAKVKGQFIYPRQVAEAMAAIPEVTAWQVEVSNPDGRDSLVLKVCAAGGVDAARIAAVFQERCKLRPVVETLPEGALPEGAPPLVDRRSYE